MGEGHYLGKDFGLGQHSQKPCNHQRRTESGRVEMVEVSTKYEVSESKGALKRLMCVGLYRIYTHDPRFTLSGYALRLVFNILRGV